MLNRKGAISVGLVLGLISGFAGCAKEKGLPFDIQNVSGDLFAGTSRQERVGYLESELNLRVVIEDQSYANEFAVNRVLRQLAVNLDALKEQLTDVVELKIGGRFERREVSSGKISLTVDAMASESAIAEFFSLSQRNQEVSAELRVAAARLGIASLVDLKGMNADEARSSLEKLVAGLRGFDFSTEYAREHLRAIQIDRIYAFGQGSIVVPFDGSEEGYRKFVGEALDLARTIEEDLEEASAAITLGVTYQPNVLTPTEIAQGLENLKKNAPLFLANSRARKPVMLGRRTESDAGIATRSASLLISYRASPAEIEGALKLLGSDSAAVIRSLRNGTIALYQAYGVSFRIAESDLLAGQPANDGSVERVRGILDGIQRVFTPLRLNRVQINEIQATASGETEVIVSSTGAGSLRVALGQSVQRMEAAIARYEASYVLAERTRIQRAMLEDLRRFYSADAVVGYEQAIDPSGAEVTVALTSALEFIKRVAPGARLRRANVRTVTLVKGSISVQESVVLVNGELKIDPYRATAEVLEAVLRASGASV